MIPLTMQAATPQLKRKARRRRLFERVLKEGMF
jgi:hypothetical protein